MKVLVTQVVQIGLELSVMMEPGVVALGLEHARDTEALSIGCVINRNGNDTFNHI